MYTVWEIQVFYSCYWRNEDGINRKTTYLIDYFTLWGAIDIQPTYNYVDMWAVKKLPIKFYYLIIWLDLKIEYLQNRIISFKENEILRQGRAYHFRFDCRSIYDNQTFFDYDYDFTIFFEVWSWCKRIRNFLLSTILRTKYFISYLNKK